MNMAGTFESKWEHSSLLLVTSTCLFIHIDGYLYRSIIWKLSVRIPILAPSPITAQSSMSELLSLHAQYNLFFFRNALVYIKSVDQ